MSHRQEARRESGSGNRSFSKDSARPLGKGYSEIMQMVLSYAVEGKSAGNPTLSHSLNRFRQIPGIKKLLAPLSSEPLCLIEGYSTPSNAGALAEFLHEINGSKARIETIDLYDLPHLYQVLDLEMPPMTYHIADAAHLESLYGDGAIDLVVQDFLLNCIPAARHEPLLKEVGRVLKPGGIGIISFTSSESLNLYSAISTAQLRKDRNVAWNTQAYDLDEMEKTSNAGASLAYLTGKLIYNPDTSEFIYVAAAGGRFEFFRSKDEMFALFEKNGLHRLSFDVSQGTDDHGLSCTRYRCVLVRQSPAQS
jgi:SAM-dependent methyltransferase